jgi:DNA-binding MarR family transcriptional regulator
VTVSTITSPLRAVIYAASSIESRVDSKLAAIGLSLPKLAALRALVAAGDTLPLGQLADRLACVKSNVTQLVDRLEADGLVCRTSDPNDRRSCIAAVTQAGRQAFDEGMRLYRVAEDEMFGALSVEESAELLRLLEKLRGWDRRCF